MAKIEEEDKKIDFGKYRYLYDGAIYRINKETKQVERLWKGEFHVIYPKRDFDDILKDPFDEISELFEDSDRDVDLLKREISKSIVDFVTFRYFYDGSIVRINKETKQVERLYKGGFRVIHPTRDYDDRLSDSFDELSELFEDSIKDQNLLENEFSQNLF